MWVLLCLLQTLRHSTIRIPSLKQFLQMCSTILSRSLATWDWLRKDVLVTQFNWVNNASHWISGSRRSWSRLIQTNICVRMDDVGCGLQCWWQLSNGPENRLCDTRHVSIQFAWSLPASANNLDRDAIADLYCHIHTCVGLPGKTVHPNTAAVHSHTARQLLLNENVSGCKM